jgi:prevent-host-death family protein
MEHKIVTLAEAKIHLSKLTELAADGGTVVITKHGKPVARVIAPEQPRKPLNLEALRNLTASLPLQQESAGNFVRRLRENERY